VRINPTLRELGSYAIAELQEKARSMREAGDSVIDFSIGDPIEPTPEFIREAVRGAVPEISQYPTVRGLAELRRTLAAYISRRFGVEIDPDTEVLPTSGSKEAIFSTSMAFVDASTDVVAWPSPGYPIYERGARLSGASTYVVRLEDDFVLRPNQIPDHLWSRVRLLWANYPHNPTGAVASRHDLAALLDRARLEDVLLCSDECYVDIYEGDPPPSILEVAGPGLRGVLSYFSLSKRSGMTGYRSGAIIGDADAIRALRSLRTSTGTASPEFVQAGAIQAWRDDPHVAERRKLFSEKRSVLRTALEGVGLDVVGSTAAIYLWVRVPDDAAAASALLDRGVVVSPGRTFGAGGEGFLRLALVPDVEECQKAAGVLQECLTAN